jgi:hypothetical protein
MPPMPDGAPPPGHPSGGSPARVVRRWSRSFASSISSPHPPACWQRTMTKVGKSDREGTFAGTRGNDKVAPITAIPATASEPLQSTPFWTFGPAQTGPPPPPFLATRGRVLKPQRQAGRTPRGQRSTRLHILLRGAPTPAVEVASHGQGALATGQQRRRQAARVPRQH